VTWSTVSGGRVVVVEVGAVAVVVGIGVLVGGTAVMAGTAALGSTFGEVALPPMEEEEPEPPTLARTTSARTPIAAPPSRLDRLSLLATPGSVPATEHAEHDAQRALVERHL
jgi:hypothetical protein